MLCSLLGHKREPRAWHDGLDFRSTCVRCRAPMLRDFEGWRVFDSETDAHLQRLSKDDALARPQR